jgi:hypothetical protein
MRSARCPLVIITAAADARPPAVNTPVAVS